MGESAMSKYKELDPYGILEYTFNKYQMNGKPCEGLVIMMLEALGYYAEAQEQSSKVDEGSTQR